MSCLMQNERQRDCLRSRRFLCLRGSGSPLSKNCNDVGSQRRRRLISSAMEKNVYVGQEFGTSDVVGFRMDSDHIYLTADILAG